MKEIGDNKYSLKEFDGYKFRAKVEVQTSENGISSFDIYTTSTDRIGTELTLKSLRKYTVMPLKIVHWASKEQDEMSAKLIDEVLKFI